MLVSNITIHYPEIQEIFRHFTNTSEFILICHLTLSCYVSKKIQVFDQVPVKTH